MVVSKIAVSAQGGKGLDGRNMNFTGKMKTRNAYGRYGCELNLEDRIV